MATSNRSLELDARSREILEAVVRLNVETGRPVSSGLVERSLGSPVSSATIRGVMKRLEQQGLLFQLHTSSGRIPTDPGFRVYVDSLRAGWGLRRLEAPAGMRRLLAKGLAAGSAATEPREVARLLSRLTDNVSIVLGPSWEDVGVTRIEVHPRSASVVLLVLILENALVRTGLVDLQQERPRAVVAEAGRALSRRARRLTVARIRAGELETPDLMRSPASQCAAELARGCRLALDELAEGEVELEGVANVLEEPEFHHPEPLKALLRFVESPRAIRRALARLDRHRNRELGVWIGDENPVGDLRRFAVVTRGFALDGRRGMMAVLGPRRMSYHRALHGIDLLGRALDESIGGRVD
ncbi:hypothetical protein DRQ50_04295 [bacterium]|nr:MAG: hypothetical protein DRQ50_04295 [bacterium]